MPNESVLVSACLLGEPCRWHGRGVRPSSFCKRFQAKYPHAEFVPVCPEMLGGLPVPRPPVKRRQGHVYETCAEKAGRKHVTGADVTDAFRRGAEATLTLALRHGCTRAILCKYSPSCDRGGITGTLLVAHGIEVINTF